MEHNIRTVCSFLKVLKPHGEYQNDSSVPVWTYPKKLSDFLLLVILPLAFSNEEMERVFLHELKWKNRKLIFRKN